jgi:hypothetical protein
MKFYDVWGTEQTYNHMSAGWSWAFDTPFDWFKQNASRLGGTGTLEVDGNEVAKQKMERTLPMILQWDESFDIGSDTLTGVNDADYKPPFPLTAKLNKLTITVDRPKLSPADIKKLEAAMREKAQSD